MTHRKAKIYRAVQLILAVALPVNLLIGAYRYAGPDQERTRAMSKFTRVTRLVRKRYVDGSDQVIGYDKLIGGALNGMLQRLDPYSAYYPPQATADFDEINQGAYSGIGVELRLHDGDFTIVAVQPGGPADQAGLQAKDKLIAIDGAPVTNWSMRELQRAIKGKPETEVKITVARQNPDRELTLTVVRGLVDLPTVRHVQMLNDEISYVHISQFNEKTDDELLVALGTMRPKMQGLILDLRENRGGLLIAARNIASIFLPAQSLIVKTVGRDPKDVFEHRAVNTRMKFLHLPLVILINSHSASAAEVLAGSLHDHGRAVLVGETSFGKALVLDLIHLPEDNSSIHLATRYYYTPNEEIIHGKGIPPDHAVGMSRNQRTALIQYLNGLNSRDPDKSFKDPQLEKAVQLLEKGITEAPK